MATTNSNFKVKNGLDAGGTITATTFSGSGASLTSLNGSNISSGTVADARIASTIARTSSVNLKLDKNINDSSYYYSGPGPNLFSVTIYEEPDQEKIAIDNSGRLQIKNGSALTLNGASLILGSSYGNVGQVLVSNGVSTTPSWGLTLLPQTTGFTIAGGTTSKTLTVNRTLTLTGTDSTTMTFPSTSATIARTDSGQTFSGTQVIDIINAASSSSTTADLFGNVTTGTVGIADGLTTGTINIGNGTTSSTGRTVNINTNASSTVTVTTNIGSPVIGSTINLVAGSPGVVLTSTGLITTSAVTGGASSIMTIRTGNTTTSGNSGNLFLDVGSAAGTAGTVSVGTSSASGVSIGRTGITTSVTGTLNQAGASSPIQLNSQAGTTGQVLTSAGSGNTPTWTTPASHTLISSVAFTSAPSFTSIPQTYKRLYAVIVFATLGTFSGSLVYSVNGAGTGYSRFQPGVSTSFTTSAGAAAVLTLAATPPVVGDSYWVEINNYTQTNSRSIGSGSVYTFGNVIPAAVTSFAFGGSTTFGTATGTAYLYGVN